jgi:hypothetical protein
VLTRRRPSGLVRRRLYRSVLRLYGGRVETYYTKGRKRYKEKAERRVVKIASERIRARIDKERVIEAASKRTKG